MNTNNEFGQSPMPNANIDPPKPTHPPKAKESISKLIKKAKDPVSKWTLLVAACFSIFALLMIFLFLLSRGVPAIAKIGFFKFLFGSTWEPSEPPNGKFGLLPMILGSIYITILATAIGVIVGIFTAIFLHRFCHKKAVNSFRQLINLLAGIPSVIFGLFGLLIIVPFIREYLSPNFVGHGILAASIILAIMIIPTIVSISLNSLHSVPKESFEGALALGATTAQAEFKVVVPSAKTGLLAATVLSIGRALGETMAVIMVIGGSARIPTSITQSINTLTALIARGALEASGLAFEALIATGVVLFLFALIINFVFMRIRSRVELKMGKRQKGRKRTKIEMGARPIPAFAPMYYDIVSSHGNIQMLQDNTTTVSTPFPSWQVQQNTKAVELQKIKYTVYKGISYASAAITLISLLGIIIFVFVRGIPHLSWNFIFGDYDTLSGQLSIKPALIGTLYLILISMVIAIPIGIATAIFMSEYLQGKSRFIKYLRMAIETLASIPSIVYGLFGYILFGTVLGWGYSLLGGGITLAIMILPSVIRTTEESLLNVHNSYREGSLALGASKSRTTFRVVLPQATSGVLTAVILAIGRVVSESAVLILTIGMAVPDVPNGLMSPGTSLALNIFYFGNTGHEGAAAATALVLMFLVVILNLLATLVGNLLSKNTKHTRYKKTIQKIQSK